MSSDAPWIPPDGFGIVEEGIYRCAMPTAENMPYLKSLELLSVLVLSDDALPTMVADAFVNDNTEVIHLGALIPPPVTTSTWRPIADELIKESIETLLDCRLHPVLVCGSGGETDIVVAILRRLQNWCFTALVSEYHAYGGSKTRFMPEQQIEIFDLDLICVPPIALLPEWFVEQ